MPDNNNPQASKNNPNEWNNWIEETISKKNIKYYEYGDFYNIQKIGRGHFGKVYRANWKNSEKYFALKSLFKLENVAVKEIIHEVFTNHINIINMLGLYILKYPII